MNDEAVAQAAEELCRARIQSKILGALPSGIRPTDEDEAYQVQAALHEKMVAAGQGPVSGYKIGCTTPVMQAYLKIPQPCAGGVLARTVHWSNGRFQLPKQGRLGVECEIAVRLGETLAPTSSLYERDDVASAVDACMASIEVVADRYDDYGSLGAPTLIADDFFNAGIVLGEPLEDWRALDLAALPGRMTLNGETVGSGIGGDIMGHPLEALTWLANRWSARGLSLPAGAFVTLGSVVETVWVSAGDSVLAEIEGLGQAKAIFE